MMRAEGQQIPKAELDDALANGTLSASRLRDMIQAEARRTEAYNNDLVKRISKGSLGPEQIKPTTVVDNFVFNKKTQPADLEELMNVAGKDPSVQEDLRRLTFKKVLDKATTIDRQGQRVLSGPDLDTLLTDQDMAKRLQTVLGSESFEDLGRIRDFQMPMTISYEAGKVAGQLAGGTLLNRLLSRGDLSAIPQFVKNFLLSTVYTSDAMRAYFSNTVLNQEGKALIVNTAIASDPWIKALMSTFGKEEAKQIQTTVKGYVNQMATRNPQETKPGVTKGTEGIPWDELVKRLDKLPAEQAK